MSHRIHLMRALWSWLVSVMGSLVKGVKMICALSTIPDRTSGGYLGTERKGLQCGSSQCIHINSCETWECSILSLATLLLKHFFIKTDHGLSHYCQINVKIAQGCFQNFSGILSLLHRVFSDSCLENHRELLFSEKRKNQFYQQKRYGCGQLGLQ